jgi:hypothetical protein
MNKIIDNIEKKINIPGLTAQINNTLSNSELNSFLIELFNLRANKVKPADLLTCYKQNRFCFPSEVDQIKFKEYEIALLKAANEKGFAPVQLSPLTPFGTCSSVAYINQSNIVSSLRGTEVVADATNILALKTAIDMGTNKTTGSIKYCTTHRHVRGQAFSNPAFSAHFGIFCMTTAGIDKGNFSFEIFQLMDHIEYYYKELCRIFNSEDLILKIYVDKTNYNFIEKLNTPVYEFCYKNGITIEFKERINNYYDTIQFKYFLKYKNDSINLADGGTVNWLQKLLENKKLRFFISGLGTELAYKIMNNLI